jgi:ATP-dependent RNA helicase SUPV3L1/SUV3
VAIVAPDGSVTAAGQPLGRLEGFRFVPQAAASRREGRAVWAAAERSLGQEIQRRLQAIEEDRDETIAVADDLSLHWRGERVARLVPGPTVLEPRAEVVASDLLDGPAQDRLQRRLARWLRHWSQGALAPLHAARRVPLAGAARGLVYHLTESLGTLPAGEAQAQVRGLAAAWGCGWGVGMST